MLSAKKIELWDREVRAYGYLGEWSVAALAMLIDRLRVLRIRNTRTKEKISAYMRSYYLRHRDVIREKNRIRHRAAYWADPEKFRARCRKYDREHREEIAYRKKLRRCGVTPEARTVDTVDKVDTVDRARKATAGMEVKRGL